jgi:hypothetical protein
MQETQKQGPPPARRAERRNSMLRNQSRRTAVTASGADQSCGALKRYGGVTATTFDGPARKRLGKFVSTARTASCGGAWGHSSTRRACLRKVKGHGVSPALIKFADTSAAAIDPGQCAVLFAAGKHALRAAHGSCVPSCLNWSCQVSCIASLSSGKTFRTFNSRRCPSRVSQ